MIVQDYELTDGRMRPRYDELLATFDETRRERFLSSLEARGNPIRRTLMHVEERHGSVGGYLEQHGTTWAEIDRVRARIRPS